VRLLLDRGADVTIQPRFANQLSLLHVAILSHSTAILMTLFAAGADIHLNSQDESGQTPLHFTVDNGDIWMAKYLLEKGASPDTVDFTDSTPLQSAMRNRNREMVLLLFAKSKVGLSSISASDWRQCLRANHCPNLEIASGEVPRAINNEELKQELTDMCYPLPITVTRVPAKENHFLNKHSNAKRIL